MNNMITIIIVKNYYHLSSQSIVVVELSFVTSQRIQGQHLAAIKSIK